MGESAKTLRVTYVGHTAELSGGELALARLLPALTGVKPHVVLAEDGPLVARLREDGICTEVLSMGEAARHLHRAEVLPGRLPLAALVGSLRATWQLARRLRSERPDLLHTNTLKAALYGGVAGRLAGVPVVWHLRDRIAPDYLPWPAVWMVRVAARVLPDAVIANSAATLATLRPGIHTRRLDAVVASPIPSVPPRSSSGREGQTLIFGLVGRLAPWKGQDLFLRAFAMSFPETDARARVVGSAMFGEDEWAQSLRDLVVELGIQNRVDFIGFTKEVAAEYARFDVFVHASVIPEPFGQVVFEAMAAGVPVVAPEAGGPGEVVTDGVDGLLYRMGDVEDLASRMRVIAADAGLRARLGEAGRSRVGEFTPDKVAGQVMEVYTNVLGRRRLRSSRPKLRAHARSGCALMV